MKGGATVAEADKKKERRELLKRLAAEREQYVKAAREIAKQQAGIYRRLKAELGKEPQTVPALAKAVGLSTDETLFYIAAMRKYGEVVEDEAENGYFKYRLTEHTEAE